MDLNQVRNVSPLRLSQFSAQWRNSGAANQYQPYLFAEVSSTMDVAAKLLSSSECIELWQDARVDADLSIGNPPIAVFAESQHAGRGRVGRPWYSSAGDGLYVTYAQHITTRASSLQALSLAAGIAVRRCIASFGCEPLLKWPNDVLCRSSSGALLKLAGVLTELSTHGDGSGRLLLGIGINLNQESFPDHIPGVSIYQLTKRRVEYDEIAPRLSNELSSVLSKYATDGFSAFVDEYNAASVMSNRTVKAAKDGTIVSYLALRVADDGGLVVQCPQTSCERILYSGEVELVDRSKSS